MDDMTAPLSLIGMSGIWAEDDDDNDVDFDSLERKILSEETADVVSQKQTTDFTEMFKNKTKEFSRILNNYKSNPASAVVDIPNTNIPASTISDVNGDDEPYVYSNEDGDEDANDNANDNDDDIDLNKYNDSGPMFDTFLNQKPKTSDTFMPSLKDPQISAITDEEIKARHIKNVLKEETEDLDDTEKKINDIEDEEDEQISLTESIDELRRILEEDGEDLSRIPLIDINTPLTTTRRVFKLLRAKRDRISGCLLLEEGILGLAYGLENVFDGKREWFGSKIDLVGWPDTIKVKLRRMRYDTSRFISGVMSNYSISPLWRIILELVPSMFLYSRDRRSKVNENIVDDASFKDAMHKLS
jgi:hypothetical protein